MEGLAEGLVKQVGVCRRVGRGVGKTERGWQRGW